MVFIAKVLLAALVIAFASWLSGKNLSSQVYYCLAHCEYYRNCIFYLEHKNTENTVIFAKSILIGVPVSYLFFVPSFLPKLKYEFLDNLWIRHYSFNYWLFCS